MAERVKDPVCGMEIEKNTAKGPAEHMGKTFYFCSDGCKEKFEREPMEYMPKEEEGDER